MLEFKKITAVIMAVGVLMSLTACGDKTEDKSSISGSSGSQEIVKATEPTKPTTEIVAAADGPRLYIGNTTAKAGEYADITLYVENAERNWNFCGIHITFPDVLTAKMFDEKERLVDYSRGKASEYSSGATAMLWVDNMPEELTSKNLGCLFFAEMFADDYGLDGDIVTFKLKIPDDAESGTVYPIGFYYMETDQFRNKASDLSLEKYAFENWQEGSITVE